jgi:hypothetical protein
LAAAQYNLLPLIVGVGALALSVVLFTFGGRGYFISRNPAIRN